MLQARQVSTRPEKNHAFFTKLTRECVRDCESFIAVVEVCGFNDSRLNGRVERVIQTIEYECLHKFIVFGQRHLDRLLAEFPDQWLLLGECQILWNANPLGSTRDATGHAVFLDVFGLFAYGTDRAEVHPQPK